MSLRHGILGLLSNWDASGYDIKKEFDDIMSIFWHSHLSQIYPELNKLENDELIQSKPIPQEGKPDKKVYSITDKGKTELLQWLLSPLEEPKLKDPFLMQTFFMDNMPFDEVLLKLKMYQKEREQRLDKMKRIVLERLNSIKERNVMKARILMSSAVLRRGIEQEMQYIKWCEDTIQLVESCKFLWDTPESVEKKMKAHADNKNTIIQYTTAVPFTDIKEVFLNYFADALEEK